ncbi:unnamed protein product [Linum trigynum]|uniref:Uncharacterized protein n=1 Tax=Linum trigynum TaxID=586398 RepID=A0AAV2GEL1_9ROSI
MPTAAPAVITAPPGLDVLSEEEMKKKKAGGGGGGEEEGGRSRRRFRSSLTKKGRRNSRVMSIADEIDAEELRAWMLSGRL